MARPVSPLNPLFVLQRTNFTEGRHEYYTVNDDGSGTWAENPYAAMLFMSIHSADQLQQAEGGDIIAIANVATYEDFRK